MEQALNHVEVPFTFAVIGDAHFKPPEAVQFEGWQGDSGRPLETEEYVENVTYALKPMMDTVQSADPSFLVLTGDVVEGAGRDDQELEAGLSFFNGYGLPLFFARGNYEPEGTFERVILPYMGQHLGWTPEERHHFFDVAGCRFVFLDATSWEKRGGQYEWLADLLKQSQELDLERIFLFGHYPIWPVYRAFFTDPDFQEDLIDLMSQYPVDAYFCGHTHNQSVIQHQTRGLPALQFMSAPIGLSDELPIALDRVQALLPDPDNLLAYWPGYLENTAPGWFMVRVDHQAVRVSWHHLNRGVEAVVDWSKKGEVTSFWQMAHPEDARLIARDLGAVRRAFLRFCAWGGTQDEAQVFLNGKSIGRLPRGESYAPCRMELPASLVQMENRVRIETLEGRLTLGNLVMEAVLPGGRYVRTRPTGELFTWWNRWDRWGMTGVKKLKVGRPLITMLSFR